MNTPPQEEPTPETPPQEPTEQPEAEEAPAPFTFADLTTPEGLALDEAVQNNFLEVLSDESLSGKDRAQKLLDMHAKLHAEAVQKMQAEGERTVTEWVDQIKADPTIGGEKLAPALGQIAKLLDSYEGNEEVRKAFDITHAGNNPAVVKFLHWVATQLNEGTPAQGAPPASGKATAKTLYPSAA